MKQVVSVRVEVPEEILLSLRVEPEEFASQMKAMAALKLFEDKKLSVGQSAEFAGMDEVSFIQYLGRNHISIFGTIEDIRKDAKHA